MSLSIFGNDKIFFDLLNSMADAAIRAASEFHVLSKDFSNAREYTDKIKRIESEADEFTHHLANRLDATFITPFDKEDLRALACALDDVIDKIESAASHVTLYRLTQPRADLEPLVGKLVDITKVTKTAVAALSDLKLFRGNRELFIEIHRIENDNDVAYRQAISDLFNAIEPDALMIIKWKEIYDKIEKAVDMCEDVANIIESVVIKYA
jgi:predicted phosphate transport protein (TIGR00153 family)